MHCSALVVFMSSYWQKTEVGHQLKYNDQLSLKYMEFFSTGILLLAGTCKVVREWYVSNVLILCIHIQLHFSLSYSRWQSFQCYSHCESVCLLLSSSVSNAEWEQGTGAGAEMKDEFSCLSMLDGCTLNCPVLWSQSFLFNLSYTLI